MSSNEKPSRLTRMASKSVVGIYLPSHVLGADLSIDDSDYIKEALRGLNKKSQEVSAPQAELAPSEEITPEA